MDDRQGCDDDVPIDDVFDDRNGTFGGAGTSKARGGGALVDGQGFVSSITQEDENG